MVRNPLNMKIVPLHIVYGKYSLSEIVRGPQWGGCQLYELREVLINSEVGNG